MPGHKSAGIPAIPSFIHSLPRIRFHSTLIWNIGQGYLSGHVPGPVCSLHIVVVIRKCQRPYALKIISWTHERSYWVCLSHHPVANCWPRRQCRHLLSIRIRSRSAERLTQVFLERLLVYVVLSCNVIFWDSFFNFFPSDTSILTKVQHLKKRLILCCFSLPTWKLQKILIFRPYNMYNQFPIEIDKMFTSMF
jgi:hypothetical protein